MPAISCLPEPGPANPGEMKAGGAVAKPGIDDRQSGQVVARWEMRANCSMSPRGLLAALAGVGSVSMLIGVLFWAMGAPLVLPFALVEMLCLATALLMYAGRATDGDVVELVDAELRVTVTRRGRDSRTVWPAAGTSVRCHPPGLIELASGGRRLHIGGCLRPERQRLIARDIRGTLLNMDRAAGPVGLELN